MSWIEGAAVLRRSYLAIGLATAAVPVTITLAAPASAECVSSAGTTICSQGSVRGSDTGEGPSAPSGPYVPYPCEYDWYCDSFNLSAILPNPGPPNPPPNRPGNRPGGGGGGGGGRPGVSPR